MKVLSRLENVFFCANKRVLLLTIIISTVLPLLVVRGAWVFFPSIFDQVAKYSDLIAGQTTWSGYFKRGDFIMLNIYFASYIILLAILPAVLNRFVKARNPIKQAVTDLPDSSAAKFFLMAFLVFGVVVLLLNKTFPLAAVFAFLTCLYLILHGEGEKLRKSYAKFCMLGTFGYFNIIAISVVVITIFENPELRRIFEISTSYIFIVLMAIGTLFTAHGYAKGHIGDKALNKIFVLSQMFLPALFIAFYQFRYLHKGETIIQFHSNRLMYVCWSVAVVMILINLYLYYRESNGARKCADKAPILLTSMISIAAFIHFRLPSGVMNSDFFHEGENSTPFHQFIQFGALPYREIIPMHGFLNYFPGFLNHLFFDGHYSTSSAGSVIGQVFLMIVVALFISRFVEEKYFAFIMVMLIALTGIPGGRWLGVFIMIFVMYNRKLRDEPISLLWWWIAISIFAIAWNPPLGGVAAISFLPLLILSFTTKKSSLPSMIKAEFLVPKKRIAWSMLIVVGIAFIPLFISVIDILIANMGSNKEGFGGSGLHALINGEIDLFGNKTWNIAFTMIIRPLNFTIAVTLFLVMLFESGESENRQKYFNVVAVIQALLFSILVSDYGFSRADGNFARMISANVALLLAVTCATGGFLIKNRTTYRYSVWFVPVIIGVAIGSGANNFFSQHHKFFSRPAINEDFVQFDGASAGISNLGIVFTSEGMVTRLTNISQVLHGLESYVDWTNNVAYHTVFGKRNPIALSSFYITTSEALQDIYSQNMRDAMPELISLSPAVLHDGRTASTGMYPVWRWTMSQGYVPFRHHDILFLLSEDSPRQNMFEPANYEFENLMHRRDLGFLPINWGSEEIISNRVMPSNISLEEIGRGGVENGRIISGDSSITYSIESPINGFEADFLRIFLDWEADLLDEEHFQVFWASEGQGFAEERSLMFKAYNGDMLLPLGSSPRWLLADKLERIRLDFPGSMDGKSIPDVKLELYKYNDSYPLGTPNPGNILRASNFTDDNWTNGISNTHEIILVENSPRNRAMLDQATMLSVDGEVVEILELVELGRWLRIVCEDGVDLSPFAAPSEITVIRP